MSKRKRREDEEEDEEHAEEVAKLKKSRLEVTPPGRSASLFLF